MLFVDDWFDVGFVFMLLCVLDIDVLLLWDELFVLVMGCMYWFVCYCCVFMLVEFGGELLVLLSCVFVMCEWIDWYFVEYDV